MSIIGRMRRQDAIYWPPATPDDFGRPAFGALVELIQVPNGGKNLRVRWEDVVEEFVDENGTKHLSRARVYVPQLPDGSEIAIGGWLWLGVRAALVSETVPRDNPGAYEVRRFDKMPTIRATEYLRTVYL